MKTRSPLLHEALGFPQTGQGSLSRMPAPLPGPLLLGTCILSVPQRSDDCTRLFGHKAAPVLQDVTLHRPKKNIRREQEMLKKKFVFFFGNNPEIHQGLVRKAQCPPLPTLLLLLLLLLLSRFSRV